jgi:hypothetical protein
MKFLFNSRDGIVIFKILEFHIFEYIAKIQQFLEVLKYGS